MLTPWHALESAWGRRPYGQGNEELPNALSRQGDLHRVALDEQRYTGAARGPFQIFHSFFQQGACARLASCYAIHLLVSFCLLVTELSLGNGSMLMLSETHR